MKRLKQRGQNLAEAALLLAVVTASFALMYTYAQRGLQARYRDGVRHLITQMRAETGRQDIASQYEPDYYTDSQTQRRSGEKVAAQIPGRPPGPNVVIRTSDGMEYDEISESSGSWQKEQEHVK